MNKNKLIKNIIIVILILSASYAAFTFYCNRQYNKGPFIYQKLDDGTLELSRYTGYDNEIEIPSSVLGRKVTSIGTRCFYSLTYITSDNYSIYIPDTVKVINAYAFNGCENLTITGCKGVDKICDSAFFDCTFLNELPYMENLTTIEKQAFWSTNIKEFKVGDKLEYIGERAFFKTELEDINLNENISHIGCDAFYNTPYAENKNEYVVTGDNIMIMYPMWEYIVVPYGVKTISKCTTKSDEKNIKEIYIPDTVTEISGEILFNTNGVTIYIPSSVEQIGISDTGIETGLLSNGAEKATLVVEPGSYAESYAVDKGLEYRTVESVQALYEAAQESGRGKNLEEDGFQYVIESGDRANIIKYTGSDTVVTFPETIGTLTVDSIGDGITGVFENDSVVKISIPDSVTIIGKNAFANCTKLEGIDFPDGIDTITPSDLWDTEWFKNLKGNKIIGGDMLIRMEHYDDYGNYNVWIPQGTRTMIPDGLSDDMIVNIYIPDSVETIGRNYFSGIQYTNIYIPSSVTDIGDYEKSELGNVFGEGICLYVEEGSYIQQFAQDNLIDYETVESVQEIYEGTLAQNQ